MMMFSHHHHSDAKHFYIENALTNTLFQVFCQIAASLTRYTRSNRNTRDEDNASYMIRAQSSFDGKKSSESDWVLLKVNFGHLSIGPFQIDGKNTVIPTTSNTCQKQQWQLKVISAIHLAPHFRNSISVTVLHLEVDNPSSRK